ncbi:MAG TPA: succinyldiaminopimelate transaminase [Acidimicrobiia bacterium]
MAAGFVPPPYPQDRLDRLRARAAEVTGGAVDTSVGTPVDPMPAVAVRALTEAGGGATGYPPSIGTPSLREAASTWMQRRLGASAPPEDVIACVGTKEVVASVPRFLSLRDPSRDTVLYPAVSYPTYEMGARLAGLRAVAVPVDEHWRLDVTAVPDDDASRALVLWLNEPANPTGASTPAGELADIVDWGRGRGVIVASDECYAEFTYDATGAAAPPVTALASGTERVLAVHSLSKRSNMAGLRAGFVAGDPELVHYLGEVRRHAGMIVPTPVQAAAAAALDDDAHVDDQRERYRRRRLAALEALAGFGLVHDGGPSTFYLWLRNVDGGGDGWAIASRLAERGLVVAPGELYGSAGVDHVRMSLTVTDERLEVALDRLAAAPV